MDYATLARRVTRALVREDIDPEEMQAWFRTATTRINRDLRVREMLTHRVRLVTAPQFDLPADFIEAHEVRLAGDSSGLIREGASRGPLIYCPQAQMAAMKAAPAVYYDLPSYFTIRGSEMELFPGAGSGAQVSIYYWTKQKAPQADTDTNPILENYEDLYLKFVLMAGFRFYLEFDNALTQEGLADGEVSRLNAAFLDAKFGDGPLMMRPARKLGGRHS